jgi:hypothetical protein
MEDFAVRPQLLVRAAAVCGLHLAALAQSAPHPLPMPFSAGGAEQNDLARGDLDGDGRSELVLASDAHCVQILSFDAYAVVASRTSLPTGVPMAAVAVGDVDRDGDRDLVALSIPESPSPWSIFVWLGDGASGWTALAPQPGDTWSVNEIALGDATGDGQIDLFSGGGAIYAGDGLGHFTKLSSGSAVGVGHFAIGDFDGDGKRDVAGSTGSAGPSAYAALSQGNGLFSAPTYFWLGSACRDVDAADVDGDGDLDLVGVLDGTPSVALMRGHGDGTFDAPLLLGAPGNATELDVADVDGNGSVEIADDAGRLLELVGSQLRWIGLVGSFTGCMDPTLADLDGDGDLDFAATAQFDDGVFAMRQIGPRVFEGVQHFALANSLFRAVAVGDLDGDGLDDVVAARESSAGPAGSGGAVVRTQSGGGAIAAEAFVSAPDPSAVELGDFDEDGQLDALLAHDDAALLVLLLGDGVGGLGSPHHVRLAGRAQDLVLGDWNGDQHLDAAVALRAPNGFAFCAGDGAGSFALPISFAASAPPNSIAAGDFDADGELDVALSSAEGGTAALYRGNGAGGFAAGTSLPVGNKLNQSAAGDFDGDGRTDLAWSRIESPNLQVLFSEGAGSFSLVAIDTTLGALGALAAHDVDADGDDDLFAAGLAVPVCSLVLGSPARTLTASGHWLTQGNPGYGIAAGHFDADGLLDLALTSFNSVILSRTQLSPAGAALYCPAPVNSAGCWPHLGWSGAPAFGASEGFAITAYDMLPGKPGLFYFGMNGTSPEPFYGGLTCILGPFKRTALQFASGGADPCSGSYAIDFNAYMASAANPALVPGTMVWGQFWARDPANAVQNGASFSGAIRFVIQP